MTEKLIMNEYTKGGELSEIYQTMSRKEVTFKTPKNRIYGYESYKYRLNKTALNKIGKGPS